MKEPYMYDVFGEGPFELDKHHSHLKKHLSLYFYSRYPSCLWKERITLHGENRCCSL